MLQISNKGLRNFTAVSLFTAFVITILVLTITVQSQASRNADDFFVRLIENRADLTHGIAIFELRNPLATSLVVNTANFKMRTQDQPGALPVKSVNYYVLENIPYAENITEYDPSCTNVTTANGTVISCDRKVSGWHWNNYTMDVWKDFTNSGYTFNAAQTYVIKIEATWSPKLGDNSREWFPEITVDGTAYEQSRWAWWDSNWFSKAPITINNTQNSNALTNYQLGINLTYDGDMQPDFSDVRFVDSTETNELNYWIEKQSNSNWVYAYVQVGSIPASSTTTIYAYYGNNTPVSSTSNAYNTFVFFDDFSGSLNASKWNQSGSALSVSGGFLKVSEPSGVHGWGSKAQFTFSGNIGKRLVWSENSSNNVGDDIGFGNWTQPGSGYPSKRWATSQSNRLEACKTENSAGDCVGGVSYTPMTNWAGSSFTMFDMTAIQASSANITENSTSYNITANQPTGTLDFVIGASTAPSSHTLFFDYIGVANFTYPEPTYSMGTEQSGSGGANETVGRNAIVQGIQSSALSSMTIYNDQQIYVRYLNGSQQLGRFEEVVLGGSQIWAFNYVTSGETATNMLNITPAFYVMEMSNMTSIGIKFQVSDLINQTKAS